MENDLNPWVFDDPDQYEHDELTKKLVKRKIADFIEIELSKLRKIYDQIEFSGDRQGRYYLGMIQAYENVLNYVNY